MSYVVKSKDGEVVKAGDIIRSFRGERATLISCSHPRRVYVQWNDDPYGARKQEYYPSVFDLTIQEAE